MSFRIFRFLGLLALFAALLSACEAIIGAPPEIAALPTLTPSPFMTGTLAYGAPGTATPRTPSPTPTITLTPFGTPTPLFSIPADLPTDQFTPGAYLLPTAPVPKPKIAYFVAFPTEVSAGETVLLFWSSEGGTSAAVYRLKEDGTPGKTWRASLEGSLTISPEGGSTEETYVLTVTNGIATVEKSAVVTVSCNTTWFFVPAPPKQCPETVPLTGASLTQEFEHGRMFWLSATNEIIILYNDVLLASDSARPAWKIVANPFVDGMPPDDPSLAPPEGRRQPTRGFGMVWRSTPGLTDRLGWAIGDETPFEMTYQRGRGEGAWFFFSDHLAAVIGLQPDQKAWQVAGFINTASASPAP
jgi:hypothetical protein